MRWLIVISRFWIRSRTNIGLRRRNGGLNMYIDRVKNKDGTLIPVICGEIVRPFADFLIYIRKEPKKQGGIRTIDTVNNSFNHLKMWLDHCADQEIPFDHATYDEHMVPYKNSLLENGTKPQSYNK